MLFKRVTGLKLASGTKNQLLGASRASAGLKDSSFPSGILGCLHPLGRGFAVSEKLVANLNSFSNRVRTRKSLLDISKLQNFVNYEQNSGNKLYQKINNTADLDAQFDQFLKKFKEENKEYPNVIDLSRFFDEKDELKKDEKLRQDEVDMLREFKKRQFEHQQRELYTNTVGADTADKFLPGPFLANKKNAFHNLHLMDNENFYFMIIDRGVTTQVTTLNRINHFRYLVFCGNSKGFCGYGKGKGLDFEIAMTNAFRDAKKNLISIDIGEDNPFPRDIRVKFNRLRLDFRSHFKFESWGNPVLQSMIILSGLNNLSWSDFERNWNRYSMVYGFFKLITQNKSLTTIAEEEGIKKSQVVTKNRNF